LLKNLSSFFEKRNFSKISSLKRLRKFIDNRICPAALNSFSTRADDGIAVLNFRNTCATAAW